MKRMLLPLLLCLALVLGLSGCGSRDSAQAVTEQALAALRDGDFSSLARYWDTQDLDLSNLSSLGQLTQDLESQGLTLEQAAGLAKALTRNLSWQVLSAQEDPAAGTARVTLSLTNTDMEPVVGQLLQTMLGQALTGGLAQEEAALTGQAVQTFTDLLNGEGLATVTTTAEATLLLVDGTWKLQPDTALADALLGGLLSLSGSLEGLPGA